MNKIVSPYGNRYICQICMHTPIEKGQDPPTCPLCKDMPPLQQGLMRDIAMNHPSVWFSEFSKLFVDSPIKKRLLEIASVVPQMNWKEDS